MNKAEREADPGSTFDGGYHLFAHEQYKTRVEKTPARVEYAVRQFQAHGIEFELKNPSIGHFHCRRKSDDKLFQFWAGTGKIMGYDHKRGIHALIAMLDDVKERARYGQQG